MMQPPAPLEGLAYYTQSLLALWPEKAVIGSCVAGAVSLFGGDAYLLWMLGAMLVADFAFGLADAVRRRHFRCRMLAHGALKFPAYCHCPHAAARHPRAGPVAAGAPSQQAEGGAAGG